MYTIGQVSEMFDLPISTLRYYDKEGFFPHLVRKGNIRYFSNHEIEALHLIECPRKDFFCEKVTRLNDMPGSFPVVR